MDGLRAGRAVNFDARCCPVLHDDATDRGVFHKSKIAAFEGGMQIAVGGRPTRTVVDERLGDMQAFLAEAIVIFSNGISRLLATSQEHFVELVGGLAAADFHRSFAAAPSVRAIFERLHSAEIGQAMGVVPVRETVLGPAVEVQGVAAVEQHGVNRRRATDYPATFLIDCSSAKVGFRPRLISPAELFALIRKRQRRRHRDDEATIGATRLDDEYLDLRVFSQSRCNYASC